MNCKSCLEVGFKVASVERALRNGPVIRGRAAVLPQHGPVPRERDKSSAFRWAVKSILPVRLCTLYGLGSSLALIYRYIAPVRQVIRNFG